MERLATILKQPSADVRVADGVVLPHLAERPRSAVVASPAAAASGSAYVAGAAAVDVALASGAVPSFSSDMMESWVREQVATRVAEVERSQAVQFQQVQAKLCQQVDAERTAVEAERAALASVSAALERAAAELAGLRKRVLSDAERQVLELAVEMARTVLRQEVEAGRHDPAPIVQAAVAQLPPHAEVTVRLNPADFARYASSASVDGRLRVLSDATVPAAGCRVECGQGVVEADPARQLDEIQRTLLTEEAVG